MLVLGVITLRFSDAPKSQASLLLLASFIPFISTSTYWHVLSTVALDLKFHLATYLERLFVIASHLVIVGFFVVNRESKKQKVLFLVGIVSLIFIYLPLFEAHDGWGYHGHNILGLSLHIH